MANSGFKPHALQILGEVARTKQRVVVTKWGKPIAEVAPVTTGKPSPGKLADVLVNATVLTKDHHIQQYAQVRSVW